MKKKLIIFIFIFIFAITVSVSDVFSASYMADKTEIPVDLEVSGAEALCQTDDGYVWIAQYSGLTKYDSKEFITYKHFTENDKTYDIINVRDLATKNNVLYVATSANLFKYEDDKFSYLNAEPGIIKDIELDKTNDVIYIATQDNGLMAYDIKTDSTKIIENTEKVAVDDVAVDYNRNTFYYSGNTGVFNSNNELIFENSKILDIYIYDDVLLVGTLDGYIYRIDLTDTSKEPIKYTIGDQINKLIYSKNEDMIFAACENNGVFCIDATTGEHTSASDLENKSQLVDLMIDYEGNLWIASHYIGASGVSIITKNALLDLLYDDAVWSKLEKAPASDRNVYAIEKHGNTLYIATTTGIYFYDFETKKILESNVVMENIVAYVEDNIAAKLEADLIEAANNETDPEVRAKKIAEIPADLVKAKRGYNDCRDIEEYNGKLYFAFYKIGLVEYDTTTQNVTIYDANYIKNHVDSAYNNPNFSVVNTIRCLRAFDDYLALGYSKGIMKYSNDKFDINYVGGNVLYINKTDDGKLIFDRTNGLYTITSDFSEYGKLAIDNDVAGNSLKFLVDGNKLYYNLNSRLFCVSLDGVIKLDHEINVPFIKGSIVEISKVKVKNKDNEESYKYVIASQTQIYIVDSLDGDTLDDYEFYDASNGIQPIIANTSGYYDEEEQKYYFQSTSGIFVYSFNSSQDITVPTKISISSVELDGVKYHGDNILVDKNTYRVAINLSILGYRPHKGYSVYYKLDGIDDDYKLLTDDIYTISYTNLAGGDYKFHVYVVDANGHKSNQIELSLSKPKHIYEQSWFWVFISLAGIAVICALNYGIMYSREKKAEEREKELKGITIESIEAIARTIDAKDTYTNGHSIRVGHYSKIIAEALGMQGDELENLYYTALLHDIGKIGIPDAILNKPGRLTDEEFDIMKSHTTKGAKILKDISTIPNIVEGAKYHHERYGGGGYPEGLKGEDIPYIARIICCADCFDAMATRRVYKDPYPKEKIISEFERCKEIQFDPKMADVVIKLIEEGKLKAELEETLNEKSKQMKEIKEKNQSNDNK